MDRRNFHRDSHRRGQNSSDKPKSFHSPVFLDTGARYSSRESGEITANGAIRSLIPENIGSDEPFSILISEIRPIEGAKKRGPELAGRRLSGPEGRNRKILCVTSSGDGLRRRHPNVRHHRRHHARRRHRRGSLERWPRALNRQNYAAANNCCWALNIRPNFRVVAQLADRSAPMGYSRDSTRPPNFR